MSFPAIILIMLLAGIAGGTINYLLPSNTGENKQKIRGVFACLALGVGATILIPLFLEIAQSELMDNVHYGWDLQKKECDCSQLPNDSLLLKVTVQADTAKKTPGDTSKTDTAKQKVKVSSSGNIVAAKDCCVPYKNYFLFAAYCFLAAAAGFRFINNIIDSVLKDKQIADAQKGKAEAVKEKIKVEEEKQAIEKENEKRIKNSQISQQQEEEKIRSTLTEDRIKDMQTRGNMNLESLNTIAAPIMPVLPPVTHPNDPQKSRFGGKAENNERKLIATVKASAVPGFYNVKLTVESTNMEKPLNTDVIFYIHDSFSPSIFTYRPDKFSEGKAVEDEILSYGAFTVGVVTDNGKTLLELDLADNENFPKEFRER
jgi:hypothetical protein